jgi:hypothetical protein
MILATTTSRRSFIRLASLGGIACTLPASAAALGTEPTYFGGSPGSLAAAKTMLRKGGSPLAPALAALLARAGRALKTPPPSVTRKPRPGASGDIHDYFSMAPYFWPDPKKTEGLPYIRRDGRVNPESREGITDQSQVSTLGEAVGDLALAHSFTGDKKFAAHAARCLHSFFLDPATRMNPNMNQAQAIPGVNTGRGIGIIEAGGIVDAIDAASLLIGADEWSASDHAALHAWGGEFLDWLLTSPNGRDERATRNNHATYYDLRTARLALAIGRRDTPRGILSAVKKRIASQISPDGTMPHELARTKSFNYTAMNLRGFCNLAALGQYVGVDLWNFETRDGRSIRKALEYLKPFVGPKAIAWPHRQIRPIHHGAAAEVFHIASIAYNDRGHRKLVDSIPETSRATYRLLHVSPVKYHPSG